MAKIIKKQRSGDSQAPGGSGARVIKAEPGPSRAAVRKHDVGDGEASGVHRSIIKAAVADPVAEALAREELDAAPQDAYLDELAAGADEDLEADADLDEDEDLEDDEDPEDDVDLEDEDLDDGEDAEDDADREDAAAAITRPDPFQPDDTVDNAVAGVTGAERARGPAEGSALHANPFAEVDDAGSALPREGSSLRRNLLLTEVPAEPGPAPQPLLRKPTPRSDAAAKAIVARAEADAAALAEAVEQELAAALVEARRRGHADGLGQTRDLIERVRHLSEGLQQEVEAQAVEASIAIARELITAELAAHPDSIVALVRQALTSARQQRDVYVRVHPAHSEVLRAHKREMVDVLGRAKDIDVREDPDLEPGGCMVETEIGTIDARLETQFEALTLQLTGRGG